jgi:hypothetical protein
MRLLTLAMCLGAIAVACTPSPSARYVDQIDFEFSRTFSYVDSEEVFLEEFDRAWQLLDEAPSCEIASQTRFSESLELTTLIDDARSGHSGNQAALDRTLGLFYGITTWMGEHCEGFGPIDLSEY